MGPITVRCASCETRLLLSEALLGRIDGQAGRISCKRCAAKIRIDLRSGAPEISGAFLESSGAHAVAVTQVSSLPPPLPEQALLEQTLLAGSVSLAAPRVPMSTLDAITLDGERRSSVPPPLPQDVGQHRASVRPRGTSITPLPPRPGTPSLAPPPPSKSLFDDLPGAPRSLPPPTLQVTEDGRLLNDADLGRVKRSRRVAPWLLAAAATFALAGGAAAGLGVPRVLGQPTIVPQVSGVALAATRGAPSSPSAVTVPVHTVLVDESAEVAAEEPSSEVDEVAAAATESPAVAAERVVSLSRASTTEGSAGKPALAEQLGAGQPAEDAAADSSESAAELPVELPPFDKSAAGTALNEATAHAAQCRSVSDPSGTALVVVTFAPSGRATSATISGPPFAGTSVGGCIAGRFRGARVPAFAGEMVTVSKTVVLQ